MGESAIAARPPKYVFVTGGVVSALGKGIVAASLGRLLKARGVRVQLQKFDPYLNVDPGTMSLFQHGEVFVTEAGAETVFYLHVTLVPFIEAAGELKTKPTQHSVNELRRIGIHPDVVVCRSNEPLSADIREKIALFADVDQQAVISSPDVRDVYLVPEVLADQGLDNLVVDKLGLAAPRGADEEWRSLVD